jgi:hypothetical protein
MTTALSHIKLLSFMLLWRMTFCVILTWLCKLGCCPVLPRQVGKETPKQEQTQPPLTAQSPSSPIPPPPCRPARSRPPQVIQTTPFHFVRECKEITSPFHTLALGFPMFGSSLALLALASIPALAQSQNVTPIGGSWSSGSQHVLTGSVSIVCGVLAQAVAHLVGKNE